MAKPAGRRARPPLYHHVRGKDELLSAMGERVVGVKHDEERELAFALDLVLDGPERARDSSSL